MEKVKTNGYLCISAASFKYMNINYKAAWTKGRGVSATTLKQGACGLQSFPLHAI